MEFGFDLGWELFRYLPKHGPKILAQVKVSPTKVGLWIFAGSRSIETGEQTPATLELWGAGLKMLTSQDSTRFEESGINSIMNVCLMLKAPREGFVKTRLAKDVGPAEAVAIYRRLVEWQVCQIPRDWKIYVAFAPDDALEEMQAWLGEEIGFFPQSSGDLGDRLASALALLPRPLIFLGGDCPSLTSTRLAGAAAALASTGMVIWPSLDGGYCLIGLSEFIPEVFERITWGTSSVFQETLARIPAGQSLHVCEPALEDIDDLASWKRCDTGLC